MCRARTDVRLDNQPFPDVLAGHVAGDFAKNVPAQVQESRAPAQPQGRVQGRAVRARRRVRDRRRANGAGAALPSRRQKATAVEQIQVHGPAGHIATDRHLSSRVQVHGKAGRSETGP